MAAQRLTNYLRTHRRKAALTQDEVAFLLGWKSGTMVSHHERFDRRPSLETALGYSAIFRVPVEELVAGIYDVVHHRIQARARLLLRRTLRNPTPSVGITRKVKLLASLAAAEKDVPDAKGS